MIELEEYKLTLDGMEKEINDLGIHFDISGLQNQVEQLEKETAAPDFYADMEKAQKVLQKSKQLSDKISSFNALYGSWEDLKTLVALGIEMDDESVLDEVKEGMNALQQEIEKATLETLLSGPYDKNNAILTLHAGAGGTEAQDWCEMLLRMFSRWAEQKGYKTEVLDYLAGDEAGVKSVTILIEGINAYGYCKSEMGVHRLVRISPFDASGRRHTSFASCEVMPEINDDIQIDINPEDLRVDTYRASGAGGQHINKTDSAIRITHIPTGVVVSCQSERSQHKNRDTAMKMLKSKLFEIKEREHKDKISDLKGEQKEIAWGSQIRSYVFHPYSLVKDHRTNFETGNIGAVMDGDLDGFINEYLKQASLGQLNLK
ncbi:MAG: peptide chain release factor 2 [Clostridia bacterium]|nr:peptide chain release factor 2 [Clostridia bacterium]